MSNGIWTLVADSYGNVAGSMIFYVYAEGVLSKKGGFWDQLSDGFWGLF